MKQLELGVTRTRLSVSAILDQFETTLGDVAQFKVGHLIELTGTGAGKVRLDCEGRSIFWTSVRQSDGRYALQVESPIAGSDNEDALRDVLAELHV